MTACLRDDRAAAAAGGAEMERAGIKVDATDLRRMSRGFRAAHRRDRAATIYRLVGHEFNIGSTKQLGEVLFDEMKLGRRASRGQDRRLGHRCVECCETLRRWHRAAGARPRLAAVARSSRSTYADALVDEINPEHRPRAHQLRARRDARPGGSRRTIPTCRTSRSAPRKAAASATPSSPSRGMCCCRPTTRRSSCGCRRMSPTSPR